jgi:hypothetical protein
MSIDAYVSPRLENDAELKAALQEFTRSNGRERRTWIEETLEQQLVLIRSKYGRSVGEMLVVALGLIYRASSEIAHGSVYGTKWSLGVTTPRFKLSPELRENRQFNMDMFLYSLCLCTCAAVEVFGKEFDFCAAFVAESTATSDELYSWVKEIDRQIRGLEK